MTHAVAVTPREGVVWFGWVLAGVFALSPLLGWLSPLGFAPLAALGGQIWMTGTDADAFAGALARGAQPIAIGG